jgi:hypothetical protein
MDTKMDSDAGKVRAAGHNDNSEIYDRIMAYLSMHIGEENAVTQNEMLAHLHGLSYPLRYEIPNTRTLLRVINAMRKAQFVIGSCARGYFKPRDEAEAKKYLAIVMESRARDLLKTIRAQRRAIYREYSGQSHFMEE